MAIAYDNSGQHTSTGFTDTFSFTVTGSLPILFVAILSQRTVSPSGQDDLQSITYNGSALTRITTRTAFSGNWRMYLYYLINPATGAHNVVITETNYGNNYSRYAFVSSYTGVLQTDSIDQYTDASANSNTINTTVVTTYTSDWGFLFAIGENGHDLTGSNCTRRQAKVTTEDFAIFDTGGALTPAGSKTMTITCTSQVVDTIMATFKQNSITSSVSDTISLSENSTTIKKLISTVSDTITLCRVFLESVSDSIGLSEIYLKLKKGLSNLTKHSANATNQDKHSASVTNQDKHNVNITNQDKN